MRSPRGTAVRRLPDSTLSATDKDRIASGIAWINGNCVDASADGAKKTTGSWRGAERRPVSSNSGANLWGHGSISAVGAKNELAFRDHHALLVLEGFEAGTCRNVAVRGTALLVEPFLALEDLLGIVLPLAGSSRERLLFRVGLLGGRRLALRRERVWSRGSGARGRVSLLLR